MMAFEAPAISPMTRLFSSSPMRSCEDTIEPSCSEGRKALSALPPKPLVDGQPPHERRRDDRIPREFLCHVLRPRANIDADGRKRVVTKNRVVFTLAENKRGSHALARVLPRLGPQVLIEGGAAAGKTPAGV